MSREIAELLRALHESGGSDLHLSAGREPRMRRRGELHAVAGWPVLDDAGVRALLRPIARAEHWAEFEKSGDLDFAYGMPGVARFRANYFVQEHGAGAVFRIIPERVDALEKLGMPDAIARFADFRKGLVLVTGPTGSGKSTTLAALIDRINREHTRHVVTIEDPVEFVHVSKKAVFTHREVGAHTRGFAPALRSAIRQDADVILVGEMRDCETISLAITAAEMGMLVFGTLHTNGAAKTIDRIVDAFPADQQSQARTSLAESLAGVISQLLLPTADGKGRCAALEILLRTQALPNVIREGNTAMLQQIIQSGKSLGMQSMDDALAALLREGRIRREDALLRAHEKSRFAQAAERPTPTPPASR